MIEKKRDVFYIFYKMFRKINLLGNGGKGYIGVNGKLRMEFILLYGIVLIKIRSGNCYLDFSECFI